MSTANASTVPVQPQYITIKDVKKNYLPMLSEKRIRRLVTLYVHTLRIGNRILVDKAQLENLLYDQEREFIKSRPPA